MESRGHECKVLTSIFNVESLHGVTCTDHTHTRGFDHQGLHFLHDKQGLVANHCAKTFKLILMTCSV